MLWLLLLATLRQASRWSLVLLKSCASLPVSFSPVLPLVHLLFT
jgi:hypothetical protein